MITDEQVREALEANAYRDEEGRWAFGYGSSVAHEESGALATR